LKVPYFKYLALLRADDHRHYFRIEIEGRRLSLRLPRVEFKKDDDEACIDSHEAMDF
jgi:hypothetical protein